MKDAYGGSHGDISKSHTFVSRSMTDKINMLADGQDSMDELDEEMADDENEYKRP